MKKNDLEERTYIYARDVMFLCKKIKPDFINNPLVEQLIRASGSVGANFREAGDRLSKKDFLHRMRITRKECKESGYWLRLLLDLRAVNEDESLRLLDESRQLRNIFSSIIAKNS